MEKDTLNLEELIEENYNYLYRRAYRCFMSHDKAEELLQETFLAAAASKSSFEGRSSVRSWLAGILRHKILDAIKASQKERMNVEINEENMVSELFDKNEHWTISSGPLSWGSSPDSVVSQKDFLNVLKNCMSKLPPKLKEIFYLREIEEFTREEISEQLSISSGNTGVILYRARTLMQDCIKKNWLGLKQKAIK